MKKEQVYTRGSEELISLAAGDRIPIDDISANPKKLKWISKTNMITEMGGGGSSQKLYLERFKYAGTPATSGSLIVGRTYVMVLVAGDDFSNVGYVSDLVPFVATGTTPTTWTNSSRVYEVEYSVIKNTTGQTIDKVWIETEVMGTYTLTLKWNLSNLDETKTLVLPSFMTATYSYTKSPHALTVLEGIAALKSLAIFYE